MYPTPKRRREVGDADRYEWQKALRDGVESITVGSRYIGADKAKAFAAFVKDCSTVTSIAWESATVEPGGIGALVDAQKVNTSVTALSDSLTNGQSLVEIL